MSGDMERNELQEALCHYTTDTLTYIDTVRGFCEMFSTWMDAREREKITMVNIKKRADKINLSFGHVTQSEKKCKAAWEYMKSKATQVTADRRRAELERELAAVLTDTLRGLEELDCFLDAVEKLAVTSLHVFMEENQVLHLPEGISPEHVQAVITAARLICPLLEFKRNAKVFFLPKLQNVEVLSYQLDKYIQTTQKICESLEESHHSRRIPTVPVVDLDVDLSEDDIQRMLHHINQLDEIRMDPHFRMVFLFQEMSCRRFIDEFNTRKSRMQESLTKLEESAVQLDETNKWAKISSVAGSSVGVVSAVFSIIGLALIPLKAGEALPLIVTGAVLGILRTLGSIYTIYKENQVNSKHQNKASEDLHSFMEEVKSLQNCLEKATSLTVPKIEASKIDVALTAKISYKVVSVVLKGIDSVTDIVSAIQLGSNESKLAANVVAQEGKALHNMSRVASDIPDIGQAAVKGSLTLSKSKRVFYILVNVLFLIMDIFFICKDSISLAKGSKPEVSQLIRAKAALLSSEMDLWQKIHDSLCNGLQTSEENKAILETPFYPERDS